MSLLTPQIPHGHPPSTYKLDIYYPASKYSNCNTITSIDWRLRKISMHYLILQMFTIIKFKADMYS